MSGTSDKARYFLEQQVPQLQELLRKELFTEAEVKSIARKRSDFEHTINARGQKPADYAAYATYELNLAALIKKRTARTKTKLGLSNHEGSRKIFFVLERGVRKFPGDLALWMQLLEFSRKEKARKKCKEILTRCLRLHPTKVGLWVYAAKYMLEDEADMTGARGYLQRGLRFCKRDRGIWIEYARLECIYVAKVAARRRILGLDGSRKEQQVEENENMLVLPKVTEEDINPSLEKDDTVDTVALQNLENTPALTGAIPIAVFDAAMKEFNHDSKLGREFFDMAAGFESGAVFDRMLRHMVESLTTNTPDDVPAITCKFILPISGVDVSSAEFPDALLITLGVVREELKRLPLKKKQIAQSALMRLLQVACTHELDPDVTAALAASLRQYIKTIGVVDEIMPLVSELQEKKRTKEARCLLDTASKVYPMDRNLQAGLALLNASKELVQTTSKG